MYMCPRTPITCTQRAKKDISSLLSLFTVRQGLSLEPVTSARLAGQQAPRPCLSPTSAAVVTGGLHSGPLAGKASALTHWAISQSKLLETFPNSFADVTELKDIFKDLLKDPRTYLF